MHVDVQYTCTSSQVQNPIARLQVIINCLILLSLSLIKDIKSNLSRCCIIILCQTKTADVSTVRILKL